MLRWLIDAIADGGPALVLVDAVVKGTILLGLATAVAASLGRSSASVRHRLWALTLCGLVVLPPLSWWLPGWRLPVLPARAEGPGPVADRGLPTVLPPRQPSPDRERPGLGGRSGQGEDSLVTASKPSPVAPSLADPSDTRRDSERLILLWVSGALVAGLPILVGVAGSEWRRRRSRLVDDAGWLGSLDEIKRRLAIRRRIELRESPWPRIPATWGIVRPVVLLPPEARTWPEPVRRLVLLHEMAHIRRGDVGVQFIGRMAAAVYWFHPLAWYALHRLRLECECACDDLVVHLGERRTDYTQQLVDLARSLRASGLEAAVPLSWGSTLEHRIKALFDDGTSHRPLGHRPARVLLAGALALTTVLATVHPGPSSAGQPPEADPPAEVGSQPSTDPTANPGREGAPASKQELPGKYTHPITVTGRAIDPDGKPIPGALVYLASLRADYKRVAETITDGEGRYEFRNVPLPIERANTVTGRDHGAFQVFGQAEGLGFAWRPQKWFYPQPNTSNIAYVPDILDPPFRYEANDEIVLDLRFPQAARLAGTIVDDRGDPRPDVRVEIRSCESLGFTNNVYHGWTLDALNGYIAPASMKVRTTDADGRFEFSELPHGYLFRFDIRSEGFPDRTIHAATASGPHPDHYGSPVLTGELMLTLATPIDVPIHLRYGDTGEPAPRALVQAGGDRVSTSETTDDKGRVTLRLPPGRYRMENWPARGTSYLVTEGELDVEATPLAEPREAILRPAAIVEVTVIDADTGEGLPDVDLWEQTDPDGGRERLVFRSWEVATRIAWRDSPRTDALGKVRVLVEPGTHRIGVGWESYPAGYVAFESSGQIVECRPGKVAALRFAMRKRQ